MKSGRLGVNILVCGIVVATLLLAPSYSFGLVGADEPGLVGNHQTYAAQDNHATFNSPPTYKFSYGIKYVGNFTVGDGPEGMAYDPLNHYMYVANYFGSNVTIMNGTKIVTSVNVGNQPESICFDSSNGYMYVANSASGNVSLINNFTVVHTINNLSSPSFDTYDPANGYVYVDDYTDNNVTVLNGTGFAGNISVKGSPYSSVYDPSNNMIYVAGWSNGNITLINGMIAVGNISLGSNNGPCGGAYDPLNGYLYFGSDGTNNISVISGARLLQNVSIGTNYAFPSFDQADGLIWTADYYGNNVTIIDNSTVAGSFVVPKSSYPNGAAFDPYDGYMYVADRGAGNVTIFSTPTVASFRESGLPTGTAWTVVLNGSSQSTSDTSMKFAVTVGSWTYTTSTPIYGTAGVRYATSSSGSVTAGMTLVSIPVHYTTQYLLTVDPAPHGSGNVTSWSIPWFNSSSVVQIHAVPNPGYRFSYWVGSGTGNYTGNNATANLTMSSPVLEIAYFSGFSYTVSFEEVGLAPGTSWSVTAGGVHEKSTGTFIYFEEGNGTGSYLVSNVTGYTVSPSSGVITVSGSSVTVVINFGSTNPLIGISGIATSQAFLEILVLILSVALVYSVMEGKRRPRKGLR